MSTDTTTNPPPTPTPKTTTPDPDDPDDPDDPNSALSRKMRLGAWITGARGGSQVCRPGTTAAAVCRMARERRDVARARRAWDERSREALDVHHGRWGRPGLAGRLDNLAGVGPRPKGAKLIRWWKEEGGGSTGGSGGSATEPRTVGGQTAAEPAEPAGQPEGQPPGDSAD